MRWPAFGLAVLGFAACAAAPPQAPAPAVEHVVVVVVDGLRPDAIAAARAPNLQRLVKAGAASATARVVERPETLPAFLTMVTSLPPSVHGVTYNQDREQTYPGETLFTRAHGAGRRTGLYYGKSKLAMLAPRGSADRSAGPGPRQAAPERGTSTALAAHFAEDFAHERLVLALVHLREPDEAGHEHGWMSAQYLAAIAIADQALGTILGAIDASGLAPRTAVLLTADHGGERDSHGAGRGEASWLIPFICRVPGTAPGKIAGPVTLLDLAPTVLALLGLPALPEAQGHTIAACLP